MKMTIRTFALSAVLALTALPMMQAEVMGTNPRPRVVSSSLLDVVSVVLAVYGF